MTAEVVTCACGCGAPAPRSGRYIRGHWLRTPNVPLCGYVVDEDTGCWNWGLQVDRDGYGRARRAGETSPTAAHRVVYEEIRGPIPSGLDLDHLCRNRRCVNPDHLEPVTRTENYRRGLRTKLTAEQVAAIRADMDTASPVLAARYGVAPRTIRNVKQGATWATSNPEGLNA